MSTKYEAVQGLVCSPVDLDVTRICSRLYEGFSIFLVFCDVISKASEDRLVLFLGLAAALRMVRGSGLVLSIKKGS